MNAFEKDGVFHQTTAWLIEKIPEVQFSTETGVGAALEVILHTAVLFTSFRIQQLFGIDQVGAVGDVGRPNPLKLNGESV